MSIDPRDSAQLNYKANIRYYQKRISDLQSGFYNPAAAGAQSVDVDTYISNLTDVGVKVNNIIQRISSISNGLQIPVSPITEPTVSAAVAAIDPTSNGEFIRYSIYVAALQQIQAGMSGLDVESLINNASSDAISNSQLVQSSIYSGYASYAGMGVSAADSYSTIIQTWGDTDSNLQQVVGFANTYLSSFPSPEFMGWAFVSDMSSESAQVSSLTNLWNSFSVNGSQNITTLNGNLQGSTPLTPDPNVVAITDTYLNYTNSNLNSLNDLLNSNWTSDNSAGILNFSVNLDPKTLQGFITALQMLKVNVNIDFQDLLSAFENVLSNTMRSIILNQLFNIMLQMFQRVFQPLNTWVMSEEQKLSTLSSQCPAMSQFIQTYLIGSIEMAETQVEEVVVEWLKNLELKNIQSSAKLSQAGTASWINNSINLISQVEKALQIASQSSSGISSSQSSIVSQVLGQISSPTSYTYPTASTPSIYNSFPATNQQAPSNACSQSVTPENMPGPVNWTL